MCKFSYRILQTSDWHICSLPKSPLDYISKRFFAYVAQALSPSRQFESARLNSWFEAIKPLECTHAIICGDLTMTGSPEEFDLAASYMWQLRNIIPHIIILPGNHDNYIQRDIKKGFYPFLKEFAGESVAKELFTYRSAKLNAGGLEIILMDQTQPTPVGNARGTFPSSCEEHLQTLLKVASPFARVVAGHYPLHATIKKNHDLDNHLRVHELLKSESVYLHGHTHEMHVKNERAFGFPVSIDAGSLLAQKNSTFTLLDIGQSSYRLDMRKYDPLHGWQNRQYLVWS